MVAFLLMIVHLLQPAPGPKAKVESARVVLESADKYVSREGFQLDAGINRASACEYSAC
jgi:hypothetical protein